MRVARRDHEWISIVTNQPKGVYVLEVKMKRSVCSMPLNALLREGCTASRATDKTPTARELREARSSSMTDGSAMRNLFDRGERVGMWVLRNGGTEHARNNQYTFDTRSLGSSPRAFE